MTLTNLNEMPPGGYTYFEAAVNWRVPASLATQGLRAVALALQAVRVHNPQAGLDPSYEACVRAISEYTCARLAAWPEKQHYWCGGGEQTDQERAEVAIRRKRIETPRGCAGCGGRR